MRNSECGIGTRGAYEVAVPLRGAKFAGKRHTHKKGLIMKFFIDTANVPEIREAASLGIVGKRLPGDQYADL